MPDRPPLQKQETEYSCGPACLRMVLESHGVSKTEAELRKLTGCTVLGTTPSNIVLAARVLGLRETREYNLNLEELSEQLGSGIYPIVCIGVRFDSDLRPQPHCAVVTAVSETRVELLDPWRGECSISTEEFQEEWSYYDGLTILVQP